MQEPEKKKEAEAPKKKESGFGMMMKSYEKIEKKNTRFRIATAINRSDGSTGNEELKILADTRETVKEGSLMNDIVSQN